MTDFNLVRDAVHMLYELGIRSKTVYEEDFEGALLSDTVEFYAMASEDKLSKRFNHVFPPSLAYAEFRLN